MNLLNIAFLQIAPGNTAAENLEKGLSACRRARRLGADIALFPEMWSNGYQIQDRPAKEWAAQALPIEGAFTSAFAALAGELQMAIAVTLLEKYPGGPKNSLLLFDRRGNRTLHYSKVHTCDFGTERNLTPGEGFSAAVLDTAAGPVRVGAMICYDREFPESARILMLQGAELILVPNACPMEINRLSQLRCRSFENMLAIATCNYPQTVAGCNGRSTLFDGIAFQEEGDGRDMCSFEAPSQEGVYLTSLDLDALRAYRRAETWGNAYRRPRKYQELIREEIHDPFIREDYRG